MNYSGWKLEEVHLSADGVRTNVPRTHENRGKDDDYDPWLRAPSKDVAHQAKQIKQLYLDNKIDEFVKAINEGGINHVNRKLLDLLWSSLGRGKFANLAELIDRRASNKVKILFKQFYAHRLYESGGGKECAQALLESIELAKNMPNETWDKWLVSGYFFLARYSNTNELKTKYCIATLMSPRTLEIFSPHIKFWKLFRAAAWLAAQENKTPEIQEAIQRFKNLKFRGYTETRVGSGSYTCDTLFKHEGQLKSILDSPERCRALMTDYINHTNGNP